MSPDLPSLKDALIDGGIVIGIILIAMAALFSIVPDQETYYRNRWRKK